MALIVAAGVINTALMAVFERTREIGTLRATGARRSQVSLLFLLEAVVLGVLGAVLGTAFGAGAILFFGKVGIPAFSEAQRYSYGGDYLLPAHRMARTCDHPVADAGGVRDRRRRPCAHRRAPAASRRAAGSLALGPPAPRLPQPAARAAAQRPGRRHHALGCAALVPRSGLADGIARQLTATLVAVQTGHVQVVARPLDFEPQNSPFDAYGETAFAEVLRSPHGSKARARPSVS